MVALDDSTASRSSVARQKSRILRRRGWIEQIVGEAKQLSRLMRALNDSELYEHTDRLRRLLRDADDDDSRMLIMAAAGVVESIRRVMGLELFDVQLHSGVIVSQGAVAEMQTGEGKTLSIAFPAYLRALEGRGVHIATPNAYLAERDHEKLAPVFDRLGMSTGLIQQDADDEQTRAAYRADITYGPGYAFGFDYLKDQLTLERIHSPDLGYRVLRRMWGMSDTAELLQRGLHASIIDEIDHVLVDDAVSPLILTFGSDGESPDADVHRRAKEVAAKLELSRDFHVGGSSIELTEHGFHSVYQDEQWAVHPELVRPWHEYVVLAMRARHLFRRDIDYVIRDEEIQIVDPSTGRIFEDRKWSDGLHQAVEAHQSMPISCERVAEARITRQRFYRNYESLAGMTGTARGCEREFASVYGLPVAVVPLRKPSRRRLLPEHHSITRDEKLAAIGEECEQMIDAGRAVLVGTLSIADSMDVAEELRRRGLDFHLLNGVQDADEASIVSQAGQVGAITVATNLAGRGTDIGLHPDVARHGGLHVIVSQPHPLARVDRQLIGRCARCGDPGTARLFLCAEDSPAVDDAPWIARALHRWDARGRKGALVLHDRIQRIQANHQRRATANRWQLLEADRDDEQLLRRGSPKSCYQLS